MKLGHMEPVYDDLPEMVTTFLSAAAPGLKKENELPLNYA
jgi:hypothetical protein